MNPSALFIGRPIGTILLAVGIFLAGVVAYSKLPVASLPSVDMPAVRISATLPGADPETVAATIAAPLERHIGEIAGVNELTSTSQLGSTSIQVQFDLSRNGDDANASLNRSSIPPAMYMPPVAPNVSARSPATDPRNAQNCENAFTHWRSVLPMA